MIGIHHQGAFYEISPKDSAISWEVDPWGRWSITGKNARFEALVEATCGGGGTPLRAPTADQGLAPFCRDSFFGEVRLLGDHSGAVGPHTAGLMWDPDAVVVPAVPRYWGAVGPRSSGRCICCCGTVVPRYCGASFFDEVRAVRQGAAQQTRAVHDEAPGNAP